MPLSSPSLLTNANIVLMREKLIKRNEVRNLLLFELILFTAWRSSDYLSLKVKDVIDSTGKIVGSILNPLNTHILLLPENIKKLFEVYFNNYPFLLHQPNAYIFFQLKTYPQGCHPISRQMLRLYIKQRCHMAGISDEYSVDSFRRSRAYNAYKQGIPLEKIKLRLGFSNTQKLKEFIGISETKKEGIITFTM